MAGPLLTPAFLGSLLLLFTNAFSAYATAAALIGTTSPILPLQIRGALISETGNGAPNFAKALALMMMIVVAILMCALRLGAEEGVPMAEITVTSSAPVAAAAVGRPPRKLRASFRRKQALNRWIVVVIVLACSSRPARRCSTSRPGRGSNGRGQGVLATPDSFLAAANARPGSSVRRSP